MRAKTGIIIAGSTLVCLSTVVWFRADRSAIASQLSLLSIRQEQDAIRTEIYRGRERIAAAQHANAMAERSAPRAGGKESRPEPSKQSPPAPVRNTLTELIADDPNGQLLLLRWQRAVVAMEYGPFFRAYELSPEQIKKFEDNWVKREESRIDLTAAARTEDAKEKELVAALRQQAKDDYEAAQAALLGVDGYQELQTYQRTLPLRNALVYGLAGSAALEGVPITSQQGDLLLQAALDAGGASTDGNLNTMTSLDWDYVDAKAREILSGPQYALFKNVAPPSGFSSSPRMRLDAAIARARQRDAQNPSASSPKPVDR